MVKKIVFLLVFVVCGGCGSVDQEKYSQSTYSLVQHCNKQNKTCICHVPPGNPENVHEICISDNALETHWKHGKHGDYLGECHRCGNKSCDSTESCEVCPEDCGECPPPPPVCGNQTCDNGESCETCELDCGRCPPVCGDELCEERESCESCEFDCGECQVLQPDCGITTEPDSGNTAPDAGVSGNVDSAVKNDSSVACYEYYCEERDAGNYPEIPDSSTTPSLDISANQSDMNSSQNNDIGLPTPSQKPYYNKRAFAGGCMMTNESNKTTSTGRFFMLILLLFGIVFTFKNKNKLYSFLLIIIATLLVVNAVHAFPTTQNFRPTPGSSDYVVTQDAKLSLPSVKLFYQYEHRPVRLITKPDNSTLNGVVNHRHTFDVLFATSVYNRFQLGLDIPIIVDQDAGDLSVLGLDNVSGGLGDVRLLAKVKLFNLGQVNFAASLDWALPTSTTELVGEKFGSVIPTLLVSTTLGSLDLAANAGFRLRANESFSSPEIQNQGGGQLFVGSLAARWNFDLKNDYNLALVSDAHVSTTLNTVTQEEVPFEWLNGFQFGMPDGWRFDVGAGWGATRGMGNPIPRVFAGLSWAWDKPKECTMCRQPKEMIKWRTKEKTVPIPVFVPIPLPTPVVVTLPSVYFNTDKSDLRVEGKAKLDKAVKILKKFPKIKTIRVEGHTDHRASIKYNQALSERRVQSVINYLKSKGVTTELQGQGFGELSPLDKSKTSQGMQINRRVDLRVIKINK